MASAGSGDVKRRLSDSYKPSVVTTSSLSSSPGADLVRKIRSGAYSSSFALK